MPDLVRAFLFTFQKNLRGLRRVKIVLELPDATLVSQIQPLMPRVMDAFQTYLRELRPTEILAQMSPETAERLTVELANRANTQPKTKNPDQLPKIEGKPSGG
jgi:flagellar motility protein MotE (MotC chaperone)